MTKFVKLETNDGWIYLNPAQVQSFHDNPEGGTVLWLESLETCIFVKEIPSNVSRLLEGFYRTSNGGWSNA